MQVKDKIEKEKDLVSLMISLYCKKKHKLVIDCNVCTPLKEYAFDRIVKCPRMKEKSFCSNCTVHCYSKDMRERIRAVMKFSGPRMILYHPIIAVKHLIASKAERKKVL